MLMPVRRSGAAAHEAVDVLHGRGLNAFVVTLDGRTLRAAGRFSKRTSTEAWYALEYRTWVSERDQRVPRTQRRAEGPPGPGGHHRDEFDNRLSAFGEMLKGPGVANAARRSISSSSSPAIDTKSPDTVGPELRGWDCTASGTAKRVDTDPARSKAVDSSRR